jgi:hypothetical protein
MSRLTTKTPIRKEQNCKRRKDRQHNVPEKNIKWTNNDPQANNESANTEVAAAVIPDG